MKVRCIETTLENGHEYNIVKGHAYLVLGISIFPQADAETGRVVVFEILNDFSGCRGVPASLFEIVDDRCSRYWKSRLQGSGELLLWPDEFFMEYFHDDLSEGVAETVKQFEKVVRRLRSEFDEESSLDSDC